MIKEITHSSVINVDLEKISQHIHQDLEQNIFFFSNYNRVSAELVGVNTKTNTTLNYPRLTLIV
jgi:hypothetical protein